MITAGVHCLTPKRKMRTDRHARHRAIILLSHAPPQVGQTFCFYLVLLTAGPLRGSSQERERISSTSTQLVGRTRGTLRVVSATWIRLTAIFPSKHAATSPPALRSRDW
jgi:hypothetical protein